MKKIMFISFIGVSMLLVFIGLNSKSNYLREDNILGIYLDNKLQEDIPKKGEAIFSKAVCDNNATNFYWDIDKWGLFISNLSKKIKCNLYFVNYSGQTIFDFDYTGSEQTFIAPVSGTYKVELWGAQGGGSSFISGHEGCDAIKEESTENNIIHTGQSIHYLGIYFTNTLMIYGEGYRWTDKEEEQIGMPSHSDNSIIMGNSGNGYARITIVSIDE